MTDLDTLKDNLHKLRQDIKEMSPHPERVTLLAVSKYVGSESIRQLHSLGQTAFGENRSQELLDKMAELKDLEGQIEWHFIGHLQSRQVKTIINQIDYLHSLDRLSLAKEIQKRADKPIACYLQVNISGEASKGGFSPATVLENLEILTSYDRIKIVGLMTMAPYDADEEELRTYFQQLKELQEEIHSRQIPSAPCSELSMGMSQDYPLALAAGSSLIRIGRRLYE